MISVFSCIATILQEFIVKRNISPDSDQKLLYD